MLHKIIRVADGVLNVLVLVCAALLLFISVYSLLDNLYVYRGAEDASLLTYKPALDTPLDNSQKVSEKQAAWLCIYNTGIDDPVMQGEDNYEFLNRDPYGEFRLSGSLFLDYRNSADFSDSYSMIYGHHMEHGAMFGSLDYFADSFYFENHRFGRLVTEEGSMEIELFAVAYGLGDDPLLFDPEGRTAESILNYLKNNALLYESVPADSRILALSTCAGDTALSRLVVFGTLTDP